MSNEMDAARARVGELERRLSEVNGEVLRLEGLLKNHLRLQAERDEAVAKLAELERQEPVAWHYTFGLRTPVYARPVPAVRSQDAIDAKRYRALRRGQAWSVIDGIGDDLRGEALDAAIDAREALNDQPQTKGD